MTGRAPIRWAQRKDLVYICVDVADIKNEKVEFNEKKLNFTGRGGDNKEYIVDIVFFDDIVVEGSKWAVHGKHTQFVLKKKESKFWTRLTQSSTKHPWLSIDWSKWVDEDDTASKGGFDLGSMNMSNLEDFGGGGLDGLGGGGLDGLGGGGLDGLGGGGLDGLGGLDDLGGNDDKL